MDLPLFLLALIEVATLYITIPFISSLWSACHRIKLCSQPQVFIKKMTMSIVGKQLCLSFRLSNPCETLPNKLRLHLLGDSRFWSNAERAMGSTAISLVRLFLPLTLGRDDYNQEQSNDDGSPVFSVYVPRPSRRQLSQAFRRLPGQSQLTLLLESPADTSDSFLQATFNINAVVDWLQIEHLPSGRGTCL